LAEDGVARITSAIAVLEAGAFDAGWADLAVRLEVIHLLARARRDLVAAGALA
jgi:hypothetical protein